MIELLAKSVPDILIASWASYLIGRGGPSVQQGYIMLALYAAYALFWFAFIEATPSPWFGMAAGVVGLCVGAIRAHRQRD